MTTEHVMSRSPYIPVRTCAGCGRKKEKCLLLRIVRTPDGRILADPDGCKAGRGAYLCKETGCLEKARKKKRLSRSLKTAVPEDLYGQLQKEIERFGAT